MSSQPGSRRPVAGRAAGAAALALALVSGVLGWWWLSRRTNPAPAPESAAPLSVLPGEGELGLLPQLEKALAAQDAAVDGWESEAVYGRASKRLKEIAAAVTAPAAVREDLARFAADSFACDRLRPLEREPIGQSSVIRICRGKTPGEARIEKPHQGPAGLAAALGELREVFRPEAKLTGEFKVLRVELAERGVDLDVRFQLSGEGRAGLAQVTAFWRTGWSGVGKGETLLLERIDVETHEEVVGPAEGGPLFSDCTQAVLGGNASFREQLLRGSDVWAGTIDKQLGASILGHEGVAIGDANGDGLEDLYVCQGGGTPNRLFVQQADGSALDVSAKAGVDILDATKSALFVDLDGDGDHDLAVGSEPVVFLENDGGGSFREAGRFQTSVVYSMSAADYDLDGDLDLYLCRYDSTEHSMPKPYHDANNGAPNVLLENRGGFRFADVTQASGIDENNRRFSFACAWADYDDDGDPDLYVANDFGRNNLYRNDGGRFHDVAAAAGVEDISAGMSASWGDPNGDGRLDLYVGNMFSSAGNRVTYQRRFKPQAEAGTRAQFQRHARGNSLFQNLGDGTFADVSVEAGVTIARWAWSSKFADVDNDGREDILVANGFVSNEDHADL